MTSAFLELGRMLPVDLKLLGGEILVLVQWVLS